MKGLLFSVVFLCAVGGMIVFLLRERPRYVAPPLSVETPRSVSDCSARGLPLRADHRTICALLYFQAACQEGRGDKESCVQLRVMREGLAPIVCPPPAAGPAPSAAPALAPSHPHSRGLDPMWPGTLPLPPDAQDLAPAAPAEEPRAPGPAALPERAQEHYLSRVLGTLTLLTVEARSC